MKILTKGFKIKYTGCGSIQECASFERLASYANECARDGNGCVLYVILEIDGEEKAVELHQSEKFW